jgi:hypothetical protein
MKKLTKEQIGAIVGTIACVAFVWYCVSRKVANPSRDAGVGEAPPYYLTYNMPNPGNPGVPTPNGNGSYDFGDIVVGDPNNGRKCSFVPQLVPPNYGGNGGGIDWTLVIPDLPPTLNEYVAPEPPASITPDCSLKKVMTQLNEISGLIGVPVETIMSDNYLVMGDAVNNAPRANMGLQHSTAYWEPEREGYAYYSRNDPVLMRGGLPAIARKHRLTDKEICKCKQGFLSYCGNYLDPSYFDDGVKAFV